MQEQGYHQTRNVTGSFADDLIAALPSSSARSAPKESVNMGQKVGKASFEDVAKPFVNRE